MKMEGKISWFGGPDDTFMRHDEGLSFWEHWEANGAPDLFVERSSDLTQGASKRLRCNDAYYIALNIPVHYPRKIVHMSRWKITNLETGDYVVAHLVDRGPSAGGRLVDASRAVMAAIGLNPDKDTNKDVQVSEVTAFGIPFGLYEKAA
jgi:hypothetical protein